MVKSLEKKEELEEEDDGLKEGSVYEDDFDEEEFRKVRSICVFGPPRT